MAHPYSQQTLEAARLLGLEIARARRERRWTAADLAERAGITRTTLRKVEHGDPTVGLGFAFEAAAVVGVPLFDAVSLDDLSKLSSHSANRLALLPTRVRESEQAVHDDF